MLDISGISLPFSVGDVVGGGMELIGLVGAFVVLALAIIFAPRIIRLIEIAAFTRTLGQHKNFKEFTDNVRMDNYKRKNGY